MKFGVFPVAECEGATLAHGVAVSEGRLAKGRVLGADDVLALNLAGHTSISVARLSTDDVPENEAAARIGSVLETNKIKAKSASTGRVNLYANEAGLFNVFAKKINAINEIDPSLTVATLPDFTVCKAGAMVATVKIIPFASPQSAVTKAEGLAREALILHPFQSLKVGLIQTTLPLTKDSVLNKTAEVTRQRISNLGFCKLQSQL